MRAFIKIGLGISGTILVIALGGFLLPEQVLIQRSVVIKAEPREIHPYLKNIKNWLDWIPWNHESDPTVTYILSEQTDSKGAYYQWSGNKLGKGALELIKTDPYSGVWYVTSFKGKDIHSEGSLTYEPLLAGTLVIWKDRFWLGNNPLRRYLGLILDNLLGADFDKGLMKLKDLVEQRVEN